MSSKVIMSYLNTDTNSWNEGIQITDGNNFIGAYHATAEGGNVTILLNSTEIIGDYTSEEPYGESKLMMVEIPEFCDVSLGEIYYAEDSFCAGEKMPFIIELTNEGTVVIDETTVEIRDDEGNLLNTMVLQDVIAPGETLETQVHYGIDSEVKGQNIKIAAMPVNITDIHEDNNTKDIELTYERVFVENLNWGYKEDQKVVISADIVNRGYHTQNNLQVSLVKDSADGEIIDTKEVSSVEPLDLAMVSFEVAAKESDVYYVVITQKNDTKTMDQDYIVIYTDIVADAREDEVIRIFGNTRYETGYKVADALKAKLGIEKFDTIIVATGKEFADALSGSYLAVKKNAPILLTNSKEEQVLELYAYIEENFNPDGQIYILGGASAVLPEVETYLDALYNVKRLEGGTRYETSLAILEEAGVEEGADLIVATGKDYADSLSASATGKPIMLVKPGEILTETQKAVAAKAGKIYIVGGTAKVTQSTEDELQTITNVERVFGAGRQETSKLIAEKFFGDSVESVVLAKAMNFPDGLCGGPLAAAMDTPLILVRDGKSELAEEYVQGEGIESGIVLGGTDVVKDETVIKVFGLESLE